MTNNLCLIFDEESSNVQSTMDAYSLVFMLKKIPSVRGA